MESYSGRKDSRSRNWVFTLNNYSDQDIEVFVNSTYRYLIFGKEVAPSTNTPHLQGYIIFPNARRLSSLKQDFPKAVHWEIAKGSPEQNIEYCSKEGNFQEHGTRPDTEGRLRGSKKGAQAQQEKWALAKQSAIEGKLDEIPEDLFIMYYNTFKNIKKDYMQKPEDLPAGQKIGFWYYGKSGRGKTYAAIENFPSAYRKISNNKWWDGYQNEDYVIIDDLDKKHDYMGYHLKIWGDRYSFIVETKGSSQYIRPKALCVTSNYHPKDIWQDESTLDPILRRFQVVQFCFSNERPLDYGYENDETRFRDPDPEPPTTYTPSGYAPNFVPPHLLLTQEDDIIDGFNYSF